MGSRARASLSVTGMSSRRMVTNTRSRQGVPAWLRGWGIAARMFTAFGAVGIVIVAGGMPTLGIWFVAIALIGTFASLSGIVGTRYQREVRAAIKPINQGNMRHIERADGRRRDLERIERMQVPPELSALRVEVIDAMRGQLVQRRRNTVEEAVQEASARTGRRKALTKVGNMVDESIAVSACWKLRQGVTHFLAEEDNLVQRRHERALRTVNALKHIAPPKHMAAAHQALINALSEIDALSKRGYNQYQEANDPGVMETTRALFECETRMHAAIKTIRGWL